jgi:mRNA deadenylase 3'-5' endonuclease subunit Ccr4
VRNIIQYERPDIICLQETKLSNFEESFKKQTVGRRYQNKIYVDANGTVGWLLLAWKDSTFAMQSQEVKQNTITVRLAFKWDNSTI